MKSILMNQKWLFAFIVIGFQSLIYAKADNDTAVATKLRQLKGADINTLAKSLAGGPYSSVSSATLGIIVLKEYKPEAAKSILAYAKKPNGMSHASLLIGLSPNFDVICDSLMSHKDLGMELVARSTVVHYLAGELLEQSDIRVKRDEPLMQAGKAKAKKKPKKPKKPKKGKGAKKGKFNQERMLKLLSAKSKDVVRLAVLASAYAKDASLKEDILKTRVLKNSDIDAAILLYLAKIGEALNAEEVADAFKRVKRISKAIRTPSAKLSSENILVPGFISLLEAIAVTADKQFKHIVLEGLQSNDIRAQVQAVRSARKISDSDITSDMIKMIPKATWPVMVEMCNYFAENPTMAFVDPLMKRLKKEKGRLRQNITWVMFVITAQQMFPGEYKTLERFWKENKNFSVNAEASKAFLEKNPVRKVIIKPYVTTFYDLEIYSDQFIYVVDASKSMNGAKIASLKEELVYSIKLITKVGRYNLIDFGGHIHVLSESQLIKDKKTGIERAETMPLTIATRSFDSMRVAYDYDDMDEFVFLSDGAPTGYEFKQWPDIHLGLAIMNRYRPVKVNMIEFSAGPAAYYNMTLASNQNYGLGSSVFIEAKDKVKASKKKKKK